MIGGIDLAAEWAGFKTVLFCEQDKYCQQVLKKHWPGTPIIEDIKNVNKESVNRPITLISGGFPCTPFSIAGKRRGKDDDRYLWPEMFRIIQELKPTWALGENVNNFVNMGLDDALSDLESAGYETQSFLIPACGVGAPHKRERVFIVGYSEKQGLQNRRQTRTSESKKEKIGKVVLPGFKRCGGSWRSTESSVGRVVDGFSREMDGYYIDEILRNCWIQEPNISRVAKGISNRVSRLKCLGNAVVPQQIYPILRAIADIELQTRGIV